MTSAARTAPRAAAGKLLLAAAGTALAISGLFLASALLDVTSAGAPVNGTSAVESLEAELAEAEAAHDDRLRALDASMPGADGERIDRDRATGRAFLLSVIETASSTRSVPDAQRLLDARHDALGEGSQALTEFLPEWMAATGSVNGAGPVLLLSQVRIEATEIRGQAYSYTGLARLDPVEGASNDAARTEFVVFTFSTGQDGRVASFEAYRASPGTREALLAAGPAGPGQEADR